MVNSFQLSVVRGNSRQLKEALGISYPSCDCWLLTTDNY